MTEDRAFVLYVSRTSPVTVSIKVNTTNAFFRGTTAPPFTRLVHRSPLRHLTGLLDILTRLRWSDLDRYNLSSLFASFKFTFIMHYSNTYRLKVKHFFMKNATFFNFFYTIRLCSAPMDGTLRHTLITRINHNIRQYITKTHLKIIYK